MKENLLFSFVMTEIKGFPLKLRESHKYSLFTEKILGTAQFFFSPGVLKKNRKFDFIMILYFHMWWLIYFWWFFIIICDDKFYLWPLFFKKLDSFWVLVYIPIWKWKKLKGPFYHRPPITRQTKRTIFKRSKRPISKA